MEERFSKVYCLPENMYSEGSPIIISAGYLLNDSKTTSLIAQLMMESSNWDDAIAVFETLNDY